MPVTVQGPDGNTYQFPDGTDKAKAIAYFKKKGIGSKKESAPSQPSAPAYPWETGQAASQTPPSGLPSWLQNAGHQVAEAGRAVMDMPGQMLNTFLHPIQSTAQMGEQAMVGSTPYGTPLYAPTGNQARDIENQRQYTATQQRVAGQEAQQMRDRPIYTTASILGPMALGVGAERVAGAIPEVAGKGLRSLTGTGESATGKFIADVAEKNKTSIDAAEEATKKAQEKVNTQNTKQTEQHKTDLSKYLKDRDKAQTAKADLTSEYQKGTTQQAKIEPTQQKLRKAWGSLRASVETAREKALATGNAKYSAINETLAPIQANPEMYTNAYLQASDALRGAKNPPGLLNAMGKRIEEGTPVSYADLQGDYSQLGGELSKGTLPGDVYHAYDQLHEAIGNEMQRIADNNGMGQQLTDARNYWRRMKQTFGRPLSEGDVATKTLRGAAGDVARDEHNANRIRLLGSFDSSIPSQFHNIENIQTGLEALPKPTPERTRLRTLTEKQTGVQVPIRPQTPPAIPHEAPVQPNLTRITPESISQQKANAAFRATESVGGGRIPKSAIGMAHYLQRNAMGLLADTHWGREFINSLTNLTQEDINQAMRLPADQRSGFEAIIREAKRRGIPVGTGAVVGGVAGALRPAGQGQNQ